MRTKLVLLMLLVAFAALAFLAGSAAAKPGGPHPRILTTPFDPTTAFIPKTAAMLPGSAYPWVHPVWTTVNGVTVVTLPTMIETANTQPPAWVLSH